jgi:Protein of unknown function (DUF3592)
MNGNLSIFLVNGLGGLIGYGLCGFIGLIWSLRNLWLSLRSKYWNIVEGEIKESYVKITQYRGKAYYPIISYRYNVDGLDYEGNKIKYGGMWRTESVANDYCERYRVGDKVKVSFDPMNHDRSVLEPGASWRIWGAIILFLAVAAIGYRALLTYLQTDP